MTLTYEHVQDGTFWSDFFYRPKYRVQFFSKPFNTFEVRFVTIVTTANFCYCCWAPYSYEPWSLTNQPRMTLNVDFIMELVLDWFIPEPTMSHFNNIIR